MLFKFAPTLLVPPRPGTSMSLLIAGNVHLTGWAKDENNLAIRDVFGKLGDLNMAHAETVRLLATAFGEYRQAFKQIERQEGALEQARREVEAARTKTLKFQRSAEGALPYLPLATTCLLPAHTRLSSLVRPYGLGCATLDPHRLKCHLNLFILLTLPLSV